MSPLTAPKALDQFFLEARARLLELTKGAPDARLTREAAATCKRLEGRK